MNEKMCLTALNKQHLISVLFSFVNVHPENVGSGNPVPAIYSITLLSTDVEAAHINSRIKEEIRKKEYNPNKDLRGPFL